MPMASFSNTTLAAEDDLYIGGRGGGGWIVAQGRGILTSPQISES